MGPTQPPVGTVLLSQVKAVFGGGLTTHLHLVSRLRMGGAIPPLPYTPLWRASGKFYLYILLLNNGAGGSKYAGGTIEYLGRHVTSVVFIDVEQTTTYRLNDVNLFLYSVNP